MSTTNTAHSVPPEVSIEGCGIDGDIPVITLDLSGGAIDRSILRGIYHAQGATSIRDARLDAVLASCGDRDVFRVQLDVDAAGAHWPKQRGHTPYPETWPHQRKEA